MTTTCLWPVRFPVSSTVIFCFRTPDLVTRSDVVLVSGIQRGVAEIVAPIRQSRQSLED
ncbi:hypothetical protein ACNKHK_21725 [Shigella flexneri]